jgi:phosphatidylserine/phosphatidylglycerophosphate/cardiolipin synthase-like enzyme
MFISYTQKKTNKIIYDEIKRASKYINITTMFFDDTDLPLNFIKLLNHKIQEHPDMYIEINIGLNPFLKSNTDELDKKIHVRTITMKTIDTYHIRLFCTESIFAVGGIDITKKNLTKQYIHFTLFIPTQNNIFISKEVSQKNILYDFTQDKKHYNVSKVDPYTKLNELINNSKHHIFIDNQYLFSNTFINELIDKKIKNDNTIIEVYSNDNFSNNIFKSENILINFFNNLKDNTMNKINENNMKRLTKVGIIVNTIENKYTHNKLFIFDKKYILIGSMNIMDKSLKPYGGDIELCVLIKNKKLANEMLDYYNKLFLT